MARKQKTNLIEDIFELVALFPWWVGVILAFVSYFVLHGLATPDLHSPTMQNAPSFAFRVVWKALAAAGQYLLPIICLAAAATSAWQRRKRKTLVSHVAESDAADALHDMSWQEFEMMVAEAFRLDGFHVEERGGTAPDGGIDMVLHRDSEKFYVQCKQWKAFQVGVSVVRELYGVMAAEGAAGGFVVTSGKFTKDATEFAAGRNVILVDGPILFDMIKHARASRTSNARMSPANVVAQPAPASEVHCPTCRSPMLRRVAKRGANAGNEFWGCSKYPACKGTREIVAG